jgi:hypothetical protein
MKLNKNAILSLIKFAFSFTLFLPYTSIIAIGNRKFLRAEGSLLFTGCFLFCVNPIAFWADGECGDVLWKAISFLGN